MGTVALLGAGKGTTGGAAAFSPSDVAGMLLWFKADALALSDGDPVSTWTDSSGNGRNATQAGSNRPTYKTNIRNGLPVVRFASASSQSMATAYSPSGQLSIFIAAAASSTAGNPVFVWCGKIPATAGGFLLYDDGTLEMQSVSGGGAWPSGPNLDLGSITTNWFYADVIWRAGSCTTNLNGSAGPTNATKGPVDVGEVLRLGCLNNGGLSQFLQGDIGEVILYSGAVSAGNETSLLSYMARWA